MNAKRSLVPRSAIILLAALFPFITAAKGEGCKGDDEETAAAEQLTPDVSGQWALTWDNDLQVEITIGGAVYEETLGPQGGIVDIDHNGTPIRFDLDCSRAVVVCPSEVWPSSVTLDQRDEVFPRNVYVTIPWSECNGTLVDTDPSECSDDAETCQVCDGDVTQTEAETFGRINFANDALAILLGGTVASNGVNCALLGLSFAQTGLETTGSASEGDWQAVSMPNGEVITGYAGGCLWAGDPNDDGTIEAAVIGAAIKFTTSFSGTRQ